MLETIEQVCGKLKWGGRTVAALLSWFILVLVACAAAVLAARNASAAQPEIVARVNGEPLTRAELQRMQANPLTVRQVQQELGLQDSNARESEQLALRKLIQRRLLLQEAGRKKITVTDKEAAQAVAALRGRFRDPKDFGAWMKEQNLNARSLVEYARADALADRVWTALVKDVHVTDEQVKQYYDTHKERLKSKEVRLQIIAVKDQTAAQEVLTALRAGKDFATLARQRSVGRRAANGGDTGWVADEKLWPALRTFVSRMKVGYADGPLRSGDKFLIVRVADRRTTPFAEASPQIRPYLLASKRLEVMRDWLAEQERKAKVEVLVADLKTSKTSR